MAGALIERRSLRAQVWAAVQCDGSSAVAIVLGSLMHAAGHAFLAAAAGTLARALARSDAQSGLAPAFGFASMGRFAGPDGPILILSLAGLVAAIIKLLGGALASWAEARLAGKVGDSVRLRVLDALLSLRGLRRARHDDHGSSVRGTVGTQAEQFAALTSHIADIERGVAHGVVAEFRALLQLAPLAVLLVYLAPRLAGSAVAALAAFGCLAFALRRAFKHAYLRATESAAALVGAADEAVKHAELWATYGAERRIRAHVARIGRRITEEAARIRVRASLLSSTSEVLGALALVFALMLAGRGYLGVDRTTVVPFAIAFFMAYKPLRELVDARLARGRGEVALGVALGTFAADAENDGERAAGSAAGTSWALEELVLADVRARHGKHAPLSVVVPPGALVAIVGPTGVGKTSLLRALLGLETLAQGRVRYGKSDLGSRAVGPVERPFAWVPQDAPVVSDTLAINIGLGRADDDVALPDPAAILASLGNAELAPSVGDAVLATERALSGGERQWIAVARAYATGLPVLLLDEPTSSLDPAAQGRVLDALARMRGKRTILVVTHRPEPLAIADLVVRLDEPDDAGADAPVDHALS